MVNIEHSKFFKAEEYRKIVLNLLKVQEGPERGKRKRLADFMECQVSFLSQVFSGSKDFSHEHLEKISRYFSLSQAEEAYLFDLLSYNRAGTKDLKEKYGQRLKSQREQQLVLQKELKETNSLSLTDQAIYYSHWGYAAIHIAVTIPSLRSIEALVDYFRIDRQQMEPILQFLAEKKLITMKEGKIYPGLYNLYVGKGSPFNSQNHANLRSKILADLPFEKENDLHYSLVFSAAEEDLPQVKQILTDAITKALKLIRPSKEEKLGMLCVDLCGLENK